MTATPSDTAALILGAAVWSEGPSPALRRRTAQAARLWADGTVCHLLPCGGLGLHPPTEAEAMRRLLREAGVPDQAIWPEDRSRTTEENIRFALPLLRRIGVARVVLVSDAYHLPRARLTARRLGLSATGSAPPWQGASPRQQLRSGAREVPAYLWYALRLWR